MFGGRLGQLTTERADGIGTHIVHGNNEKVRLFINARFVRFECVGDTCEAQCSDRCEKERCEKKQSLLRKRQPLHAGHWRLLNRG